MTTSPILRLRQVSQRFVRLPSGHSHSPRHHPKEGSHDGRHSRLRRPAGALLLFVTSVDKRSAAVKQGMCPLLALVALTITVAN